MRARERLSEVRCVLVGPVMSVPVPVSIRISFSAFGVHAVGNHAEKRRVYANQKLSKERRGVTSVLAKLAYHDHPVHLPQNWNRIGYDGDGRRVNNHQLVALSRHNNTSAIARLSINSAGFGGG